MGVRGGAGEGEVDDGEERGRAPDVSKWKSRDVPIFFSHMRGSVIEREGEELCRHSDVPEWKVR